MKPSWAFVGLMGLGCICAVAVIVTRLNLGGVAGSVLTVRVVAHEWWWEFDYPSLGIKTSNVLYLPSATNVQLELVSADVIHSFWIAGMTKSVEVLPGEAHSLDLFVESPGKLNGNCDSGCGCEAVCMRFRVLARSPKDFERWAARKRLSRMEFRPPSKGDAPACALNAGRNGRARHDYPAGRLQRLLDGGEPNGTRHGSNFR